MMLCGLCRPQSESGIAYIFSFDSTSITTEYQKLICYKANVDLVLMTPHLHRPSGKTLSVYPFGHVIS